MQGSKFSVFSDTNGVVTITNAVAREAINCNRCEANLLQFSFYRPETNGTIYMEDHLVADAGNTLPPDTMSYGVTASDRRYAMLGNGVATNVIVYLFLETNLPVTSAWITQHCQSNPGQSLPGNEHARHLVRQRSLHGHKRHLARFRWRHDRHPGCNGNHRFRRRAIGDDPDQPQHLNHGHKSDAGRTERRLIATNTISAWSMLPLPPNAPPSSPRIIISQARSSPLPLTRRSSPGSAPMS